MLAPIQAQPEAKEDEIMDPVIVTTQSALEAAVEKQVAAAMQAVLPDLIRRAVQPEYLTKAQLKTLTGWSDRTVEYKKSAREIPFIRRGRLVLFPTSDVFAYLEEGRVPARSRRRGARV